MKLNRFFAAALLMLAFACELGAQGKELLVLHTSDTHSRIEPIEKGGGDKNAGLGGYVRRSTFVNDMRGGNPDLLLLDCGDFSQGTPYYNMFMGEVEVKLMNHMKYDAATIGNHEFDFGLENMARLFRMADFPIVCANYDVSATVLKDLVKPYVIIKRGGLNIGIIGVSPKMEGLVQAEKCEGIVFNDPATVANELAAFLRNEKHCDAVICLSHLGVVDDGDFIKATSGIDLVLGGHSHTFMDGPTVVADADNEEVTLLHTGKNGVRVGVLRMQLSE